MTDPKDDGRRLHLLMAALADSVADASDADILEDAQATSTDRSAAAERVRGVLGDALRKAKKARLRKAQEGHVAAVAALRERKSTLPDDPGARRALLAAVISRRPDMRSAVMTFQHRDLNAVTDEDVESALRQLEALGVLTGDDSDDA